MAQQNGGHDLSNNMAAATQQLLSKLEEDLPTIVSKYCVLLVLLGPHQPEHIQPQVHTTSRLSSCLV